MLLSSCLKALTIMKKIESSKQLKLEIARLKRQKAEQEIVIENNIQQLKDKYSIKNFLAKGITTKEGNAGILSHGLGAGISFLTQKLLFKNSSVVMKTIMSLLMENVSANMIGDKGGVFGKIKDFIKNKFSKSKNDDLYPDEFDYSK